MSTELEPIEINCDTCDDNISPKRLMSKRRASKSFGDVTDPIEEELRDPDRASMIYAQIPIIPFFDNSDATLRVMRRMRELSPTHSSCISNVKEYVFGGELTIRKYVEPGMAFDSANDQGISDTEQKEYVDFIKSLNPSITFGQLLEVAKGIYENLKTYGNAFLRIDAVKVAGQWFFYFESVDAEKCRYYATERNQPKILVISPEWTAKYIAKNPPEFVSTFPNWSDFENGTMTTIIHIKNAVVGRDWYGLPESFGSLYWQYMEVQQGQHGTSGYANDFIARVFFEITAEPEKDGDEDGFDDAVERTFTNRANEFGDNPRRFIIRRKLPDDDAATVHEFKANTEHEYHVNMGSHAERQIIKSHNWHSLLMGTPTAGKLGQSQEFKEVFRQYFNNVIRPWQERCIRPLIEAIQACEFLRDGKKDISTRLSLGLFNLYEEYLKNPDPATQDANANSNANGNGNV